MSRVGKRPIPTPSGVSVTIAGQAVNVKGPKGALTFEAPDEGEVRQEGGEIVIKPRRDDQRSRAMWGMVRAIVANNVKGVTEGFEKNL